MSSSDTTPPRFLLINIGRETPNNTDFTDSIGSLSTELALMYNVLIRGLNSVHHHARYLQLVDARAFAGYNLTLVQLIRTHQVSEEILLRPFTQTKSAERKTSYVAERREYNEQLAAFETYMQNVVSGKAIYDGEVAEELLEELGWRLGDDAFDVVERLSPGKLVRIDANEFNATLLEWRKWQAKSEHKSLAGLFVVTHHDFEANPTWPSISKLTLFMMRNVLYWRHSSYWRFAPFTRSGKPRGDELLERIRKRW